MAFPPTSLLLIVLAVVLLLARPAQAFGAGNIASVSAVEGTNWRHGDIEDTLLSLVMARVAGGKKFNKLMVARVYFGNWLRDYSQAIDVGTVKYVSAEAIRILLWVLGFMTFGYGTKEFEVTSERLGCYRPEDHIDNPKDYADNLDAREYDPRLRGPVNERVELAIDPKRGLKNYIASEEVGIMTSAAHVRKLFKKCIELGRNYGRNKREADLYEALRLMGTGLHCLEDFSAHSNYTELALIEMGERDVFPFVGRQTQMRLPGVQYPVYPIITGTFGGVDFLHSVMGEFDDKATQSELQQLEDTMATGDRGVGDNTNMLKGLLGNIPGGLLGGEDQASKADELQANSNAARMQNMHVTPKKPEAITQQMIEIQQQIYPILEWHDDLMRTIAEAIEAIPVLPELIEQLEDQVNIFVFTLLAPFMLPVINALKYELNQGSSEIIKSSKDKQLNVFHDDRCTDPTHSMLSKDHFSDVLNEPAGKIASAVVAWTVPQLMQAWDDPRIDPDRTINRIVNGVFHHPALRNSGEDGAMDCRRLMFGAIEQWWRRVDQNELRRQLSRDGVEQGLNHKPGQHDTGHGCGKPLGMAKHSTGDGASGGMLGDLLSALGGGAAATGIGQGYGGRANPMSSNNPIGGIADMVGGGALGGLVGTLASGLGGDLLGDVLGGQGQTQSYSQQYQSPSGGITQSYTEFGQGQTSYGQPQYGQAQVQQTQYPGGGRRTEYKQYEQYGQAGQAGYGYEKRTETQPTYGGGFETKQEEIYKKPGGTYVSQESIQGRTGDGEYYRQEKHHERRESGSGEDSDGGQKKYGKHHKKKHHGRGSGSDEEEQRPQQPSYSGGYGRQESSGYGSSQEPPHREYGGGYGGGGREGYEEPPRQEYGGEYGRGGRGGYEEPPRQEYSDGYGGGGRGGYEEPPRREYGGGYGEPPRRVYGGGYGEPPRQEYGGGYGEPPRQEYSDDFGGGRRGYEERREETGGGFGRDEREEDRQEEYREEIREEEQEERRGGWGF